jgi:hypothetical protein
MLDIAYSLLSEVYLIHMMFQESALLPSSND